MNKIRLGISTCLLGEPVRYDGGHKLDRFLTETLGRYVEYVPVCPEVECGLPVPRESMRLEGDPDSPRLVTSRTGQDMTDRLIRWARKRVIELEKNDLHGFIFKSNSPAAEWSGSGFTMKKACRSSEGQECSPGYSWNISHCFRSKTKAASTTRACGKISSSGFSS